MEISKNQKNGSYMSAATTVTIQELTAMSEFIRNFKLKYARKRANNTRKKK
jgi:hypothetical protein